MSSSFFYGERWGVGVFYGFSDSCYSKIFLKGGFFRISEKVQPDSNF